jgi:hypothetical protein
MLGHHMLQSESVEVQPMAILHNVLHGVSMQTEPVETEFVEPLDAVFDEILLIESVEVLHESIPAFGHIVGRSNDSDAKKTKSMAELLGV